VSDRKENQTPLNVGLVSLGCAKNLVDAEIMLGALAKSGLAVTNDAASADVLIVNTCSFIDTAQEESVDTILEFAAAREQTNPRQGLVVAGCLPQRHRDQLPDLFPEVDVFMGIDQVGRVGELVRQAHAHRAARLAAGATSHDRKRRSQVVDRLGELEQKAGPEPAQETLRGTERFGHTRTVIAPAPTPAPPVVSVNLRPTYIPDYATPRFRLTPKHLAYVKIAEGCNHPCSFCIIPRMRGSYRSRPQADIVREARALLAAGVKELNLISQDSTYYGLDLRAGHSRAISSPERFSAAARALPANATTLSTLLRELNDLPGRFWIRLLYTHPAHWTEELIRTIAECPKVARYADIPLQHIHDHLLERMRRETSRRHIEELLVRIRAGIPGIALRTTFIVGFPGETEACFEELLRFIRETRFDRLGVFTYSREDGTRAGKMAGQIPAKVKQQRRDLAMAEQRRVARQVAESQVGRRLRVLVEGTASPRQLRQANIRSWEHGFLREADPSMDNLKGHYLTARSEADAPDIDGRVYIRGVVAPGNFAEVKVIGHTDYDLIAKPV